eukprot:SAG31_NODE_5590_length_2438_cov_1.289867_4_plen_80_part_00
MNGVFEFKEGKVSAKLTATPIAYTTLFGTTKSGMRVRGELQGQVRRQTSGSVPVSVPETKLFKTHSTGAHRAGTSTCWG